MCLDCDPYTSCRKQVSVRISFRLTLNLDCQSTCTSYVPYRPEALGIVPGTVFLTCLICCLMLYATTNPSKVSRNTIATTKFILYPDARFCPSFNEPCVSSPFRFSVLTKTGAGVQRVPPCVYVRVYSCWIATRRCSVYASCYSWGSQTMSSTGHGGISLFFLLLHPYRCCVVTVVRPTLSFRFSYGPGSSRRLPTATLPTMSSLGWANWRRCCASRLTPRCKARLSTLAFIISCTWVCWRSFARTPSTFTPASTVWRPVRLTSWPALFYYTTPLRSIWVGTCRTIS